MSDSLPPKKSEAVNNTHIIFCDNLNRRCHYCICLNFLRAVDEDRIMGFDDCQVALRKGKCSAVQYRDEERAANKALYYYPRKSDPKIPVAKPMAKQRIRLAPKASKGISNVTKPNLDTGLIGADMSLAITAAVNSPQKSSKLLKPMVGESPVQFGRRYKNNR